jgi:hypothetical protein
MAKRKKTNYDPQNNTQKTKYCAKRTPLKAQDELMCSVVVEVPVLLVGPVVLLLNNTRIIWYGQHVEHQYMQNRVHNIIEHELLWKQMALQTNLT